MSAFIDISQAMADHLETITGLSGVEVIVVKNRDLGDRVAEAIAKRSRKGVIAIRWVRFVNQDPNHIPARVESDFAVAIATKPILRRGEMRMDQIVEKTVSALHGFQPNTSFGHYHECRVMDGALVAETSAFLVHQLTVKAITPLPQAS